MFYYPTRVCNILILQHLFPSEKNKNPSTTNKMYVQTLKYGKLTLHSYQLNKLVSYFIFRCIKSRPEFLSLHVELCSFPLGSKTHLDHRELDSSDPFYEHYSSKILFCSKKLIKISFELIFPNVVWIHLMNQEKAMVKSAGKNLTVHFLVHTISVYITNQTFGLCK